MKLSEETKQEWKEKKLFSGERKGKFYLNGTPVVDSNFATDWEACIPGICFVLLILIFALAIFFHQ